MIHNVFSRKTNFPRYLLLSRQLYQGLALCHLSQVPVGTQQDLRFQAPAINQSVVHFGHPRFQAQAIDLSHLFLVRLEHPRFQVQAIDLSHLSLVRLEHPQFQAQVDCRLEEEKEEEWGLSILNLVVAIWAALASLSLIMSPNPQTPYIIWKIAKLPLRMIHL